ncbi:AMP-binding protein [Salinisphaera orenii]|uniref:AMP-binding protein n=1 Tax=Salinisphaera orenii TaxID=856731 RepID=UPI000DBE43A9
MADNTQSLIVGYQPERTFAWVAGQPVRHDRALAVIETLAEALSPGCDYINCCADRSRFTLAFAAVCLAGGSNLLSPAANDGELTELTADYPDAARIGDDDVAAAERCAPPAAAGDVPRIASTHCVARVFTSGTTGKPQSHAKYWADMVTVAHQYRDRFFGTARDEVTVATVPPNHMYGFETTVLPALCCGLAVAAERPFTPWAIRDALAVLPAPTLLITTPVHLRALAESGVELPNLGRVVSATAPLPAELAATLEDRWGTPIEEIFGSTETGSIASRRTIEGDWYLYDGVRLQAADAGGWQAIGPQLPEPQPLGDSIEPVGDYGFRFLGRASDLLKVGGKRLSRSALETMLLEIDGVTDAAVLTAAAASRSGRPRALVVSHHMCAQEIATALAERVDPVFVPRPLVCVEQLPRNAVGKLTRESLESLLGRVAPANTADG